MYQFVSRSLAVIFLILAVLTQVNGDSTKLDGLRIGVTHKIDEDKCHRKTKAGDLIAMHYKGTLLDGTEFDSSYQRGQPLEFTLGAGQVIQGWDQGLQKMCIGEKRKLTIPPHLAYGKRGAGGVIPPDATLIFYTELVGIEGYEEPEEEEAVERDEL